MCIHLPLFHMQEFRNAHFTIQCHWVALPILPNYGPKVQSLSPCCKYSNPAWQVPACTPLEGPSRLLQGHPTIHSASPCITPPAPRSPITTTGSVVATFYSFLWCFYSSPSQPQLLLTLELHPRHEMAASVSTEDNHITSRMYNSPLLAIIFCDPLISPALSSKASLRIRALINLLYLIVTRFCVLVEHNRS